MHQFDCRDFGTLSAYFFWLQVEDLYRRIVEAFRSRMPKTDWMDAETRSRALDKVNGLSHKIGYPDFLLDPAKLDQFYSKV